jgi:uncharacterized membrane protein (Fun14 family)
MQKNLPILDPRKYTKAYPESNMIIKQTVDLLSQQSDITDNKSSKSIDEAKSNLISTLERMLQHENDALINVALNLSPSYAATNLIWQCLNMAINNSNGDIIFAIPLVLVAGSKIKSKINGSIDSVLLNNFVAKNNLVNSDYDFFISGKLIDATTIAKIQPSQLYYWVRNIKSANLWLPQDLQGSDIEVQNEGVFLRFLIGVATKKNQTINTIINTDYTINTHINNYHNVSCINQEKFRNSSMAFMQLINQELQQKSITLFTIPFTATYLSDAFRVGDNYRREIAIQVALSNAIREVRAMAITPLVIISAINVENAAIQVATQDAIQLTVYADSKIIETSVWNLNHLDDFNLILNTTTELLDDMQVMWNYAATE